jgi:hypothetical protein
MRGLSLKRNQNMKYFTLIIVAILFGAAGWSLRGEWGTDGVARAVEKRLG